MGSEHGVRRDDGVHCVEAVGEGVVCLDSHTSAPHKCVRCVKAMAGGRRKILDSTRSDHKDRPRLEVMCRQAIITVFTANSYITCPIMSEILVVI